MLFTVNIKKTCCGGLITTMCHGEKDNQSHKEKKKAPDLTVTVKQKIQVSRWWLTQCELY